MQREKCGTKKNENIFSRAPGINSASRLKLAEHVTEVLTNQVGISNANANSLAKKILKDSKV